MEKLDMKKTLSSYRARSGVFDIIDVPPVKYMMIDGHGDPNVGGPFAEAVTALFSVGYTLKFASKKELGRDYAVMPLEGLWWSNDPADFTTALDKSQWNWTLMMAVPDWIDQARFVAATTAAEKKAGPAARQLRLAELIEGRCVQTLHLGSFDSEAEMLHRLHTEFLPDNGLGFAGHHHEIYLSDFRKTAPEKLRTIVRQPVTDQLNS